MALTIAGLGFRPCFPTISPTSFASSWARENLAMPKLMAKAVAVSNAINTDIMCSNSSGLAFGHHTFHFSASSS